MKYENQIREKKNMVMDSIGPESRNDCAGKDQQQFTRNELWESNLVPPECKTHELPTELTYRMMLFDTPQRYRIESISRLQQRGPLSAVRRDAWMDWYVLGWVA
jgi:hypothetical protein